MMTMKKMRKRMILKKLVNNLYNTQMKTSIYKLFFNTILVIHMYFLGI